MTPPNLNALWAETLMDALAQAGVAHVCLSPGSRSTPLSNAAYLNPELQTTVHLDERSAAFFALGVAKATGKPVALVCTSGTAAANYHPAVIEASLSRVPLIVLSADRPPELRQAGAAQTIDQIGLFGTSTRFFQDLPVPEPELSLLQTLQAVARHAVTQAIGHPAGPVHLNIPLRDPLPPIPKDEARMAELAAELERDKASRLTVPVLASAPTPLGAVLLAVADALAKSSRPLIVAGPQAVGPDEATVVTRFAERFGIPVIADLASGLRFLNSPVVLSVADAYMKLELIAAQAPDLVIQLGDLPTSKSLNLYLARHRAPTLAISPDRLRHDPEALVHATLDAPVGWAVDRLSELVPGMQVETSWTTRFQELDARTAEYYAATELPLESLATVAAVSALPPGGSVFFSNSMPIRYGETFLKDAAPGLRIHVSRGANGIDGIPSTAAGLAAGTDGPMLLVTGDLAFLHDVGGLAAARYAPRGMVIMLLNNDGGGIFNFLPISAFPQVFEPLFGTPHGLDLSHASKLFGWQHVTIRDAADVQAAVEGAFREGGLHVIEVVTTREETVRQHRAVLDGLADVLQGVPC
ncbi:2-succinyl-5-enolpyruvyl-6-hydroxy-3-cyclohexene-1-carboxylate synthase [compost metagenome]